VPQAIVPCTSTARGAGRPESFQVVTWIGSRICSAAMRTSVPIVIADPGSGAGGALHWEPADARCGARACRFDERRTVDDGAVTVSGSGEIIGILGGMGPAATADFYGKLVAMTPARRDQEHLRIVIWSDPTMPDRTEALLGRGPDPTPWLLDGCRVLREAGATVIAIPCNTAHAFVPRFAERAGLPIVHMIGEVAGHLAAADPPVRLVGLLATDGTIRSELYQQWLGRIGIGLVLPDPASQAEEVTAAIRALKAGRRGAGVAEPLRWAAKRLVDRGAQAVIAGCTEIPLGLSAAEVDVPLVDPAAVLARALIRRARPDTRPDI
jgi:aspartate racemase